MILSVSNIAWSSAERFDAYDMMAEAGFSGLEIAPSLFFAKAEDPFEPDAATANEALAEITARGLILVSMQSLLFGVQGAAMLGNSVERAVFERGMTRAINLAGRFGIPNLVFGSPGQRRIPEEMEAGDALVQAVEIVRRLGDRAAAAGTVIAMEANPAVYGSNFLTTTEEADAFVAEVDHKAVTLTLDLGSIHVNGGFDSLPDRVSSLASRITHVHVSEPHLAPAPNDATDLGPLLRELRKAGYTRAVSLEMKRPPRGLESVCGRLTALARSVSWGSA